MVEWLKKCVTLYSVPAASSGSALDGNGEAWRWDFARDGQDGAGSRIRARACRAFVWAWYFGLSKGVTRSIQLIPPIVRVHMNGCRGHPRRQRKHNVTCSRQLRQAKRLLRLQVSGSSTRTMSYEPPHLHLFSHPSSSAALSNFAVRLAINTVYCVTV